MQRFFFLFLVLSGTLLHATPWEDSAAAQVREILEQTDPEEVLRNSALSPYITEDRVDELVTQWRGVQLGWQDKEEKVEVVESDREETLAAVLVKISNLENPSDFQFLGVTAVEVDGEWKAGPSPGLFSNIQLGYEDEVLARASELERWLSEKRGEATREAVQQDEAMFTTRMLEEKDAGFITNADPRVAIQRFFEVVRARNLPAVMAFQGGLAKSLPDSFEQLKLETAKQLTETERYTTWSLMANPVSVAVPVLVEKEADDVTTCVGLWAPDRPLMEFVWFEFSRQEGNWRVFLPDEFSDELYESVYDTPSADEWVAMAELFPEAFFSTYGSAEFLNKQDLESAVLEQLKRPSLAKLGSLLHGESEEVAIDSFLELNILYEWGDYASDGLATWRVLSTGEEGKLLLGQLEPYSFSGGEIFSLNSVERDGKWGLGSPVFLQLSESEAVAAVSDLATQVYSELGVKAEWPSGSPPNEAGAKSLIEEMMTSEISSEDLQKKIALLPIDSHRQALQNQSLFIRLRNEHATSFGNVPEGKSIEIRGDYSSGSVRGSVVMVHTGEDAQPESYVILTTQTADSPQIVMDLVLREPGSTKAKLVNEAALTQLDAQDAAAQQFLEDVRRVLQLIETQPLGGKR